jgi:large subunit ribosomal protein L15
VNLDTIQLWINKGRIDPAKPITIKELTKSKCVNGVKDGVKLLARGKTELTSSINIVVSRASEEAIEAVEKLGGTVTSRYYTKFAVKKIKAGEMDPIHSLQSCIEIPGASSPPAQAALGGTRLDRSKYLYRLPDPTSRKDFEYYRDSTKRGYLSHTVAAGHGPSLFFKNPAAPPTGTGRKAGNRTNKLTKQQQEASRLW